jgi:hypothetical protein
VFFKKAEKLMGKGAEGGEFLAVPAENVNYLPSVLFLMIFFKYFLQDKHEI